jgi:hypothetical protein
MPGSSHAWRLSSIMGVPEQQRPVCEPVSLQSLFRSLVISRFGVGALPNWELGQNRFHGED